MVLYIQESSLFPFSRKKRGDTSAGFFTVRKTEENVFFFQTWGRKVLAVIALGSSLRARIVLLEVVGGVRKRVLSCLSSLFGSFSFVFGDRKSVV